MPANCETASRSVCNDNNDLRCDKAAGGYHLIEGVASECIRPQKCSQVLDTRCNANNEKWCSVPEDGHVLVEGVVI
eukprot:Awhi_evm1s3152